MQDFGFCQSVVLKLVGQLGDAFCCLAGWGVVVRREVFDELSSAKVFPIHPMLSRLQGRGRRKNRGEIERESQEGGVAYLVLHPDQVLAHTPALGLVLQSRISLGRPLSIQRPFFVGRYGVQGTQVVLLSGLIGFESPLELFVLFLQGEEVV